MSPLAKRTRPGRVAGRRAAGDLDQRGRDVDGGHIGAARGQFRRHLPGAAAGIQHPRAAQVGRQARQHRRAHPVAPFAHRLADAADRRVRGQTLPDLGGAAVEIVLDPVAVAE